MSEAKRLPWMKWFPADWRADPLLRMCGLAARGLWADMLTIMHDEGEPYGHLSIKGRALTTRQLASLVGAPPKDVQEALDELRDAGVYSATDDGVIFSRRMVRDKARSDRGRDWGHQGGNPALTGKDKPTLKGTDKAPDKAKPNGRDMVNGETALRDTLKQTGDARDLEARSQKEETRDTEPTESLPAVKSLVSEFVRLRAEHWPGTPNFHAPIMTLEAQAADWLRRGATVELVTDVLARAMAAKVAKCDGPPTDFGCVNRSLPDAIARAKAASPGDPVYIDQAAERWRAECVLWERSGRTRWRGQGAAPDDPNTDVPADIRAELGIETREAEVA